MATLRHDPECRQDQYVPPAPPLPFCHILLLTHPPALEGVKRERGFPAAGLSRRALWIFENSYYRSQDPTQDQRYGKTGKNVFSFFVETRGEVAQNWCCCVAFVTVAYSIEAQNRCSVRGLNTIDDPSPVGRPTKIMNQPKKAFIHDHARFFSPNQQKTMQREAVGEG